MSEDAFRMIVAGGVALAAVAFVVQAIVVLALYSSAKKTQLRIATFIGQAEPVVAKVGPVVDRIGPTIDRLHPVIDRIGPVLDQFAPAVARIVPAVERIGPAADRIGQVVEKFGGVVTTANRILDETRPRINEITAEALAIAKTGHEQVDRLGNFLNDASDRARHRLEQIDHAVESTVGQVEHVGDTVKRAVLKPVKGVNGVAAGISAAVSTLVHGSRKSSVDSATQDEEMFI